MPPASQASEMIVIDLGESRDKIVHETTTVPQRCSNAAELFRKTAYSTPDPNIPRLLRVLADPNEVNGVIDPNSAMRIETDAADPNTAGI